MTEPVSSMPPVVQEKDVKPYVAYGVLAGAFAVALGLVFVILSAIISSPRGQAVVQEVVPFLDGPLSTLTQWEVDCSAVTPTDLTVDTGGTKRLTETLYVANDSATCVRVGGDDVASTTGASIGNGCRDGNGISVDAKRAWCLSASGTITVDVVGGKR